ncbi:MAG: hypothetical protein KKG75_04085 [Nanoarchaeota archaeon]|nr:hypothetical protein [Nanoarchaeota archaeon]
MANEEQIGFHKGSLATLAKEREELIRLINITQQLMQAHIKALKELGIDLEAEAKKAQEAAKKESKKKLDEKVA